MKDEISVLDWRIDKDAKSVAKRAAEWILRQAEEAIAERGKFTLVLSGGRTPELVYRLLSESNADWSKWALYYGDERCLPEIDPDRNSWMVDKIWLTPVQFPESNHFPIPAEMGAEKGAHCYECAVRGGIPFDLVLLGMGEDGHTASLFPSFTVDFNKPVLAVFDAPKPPSDRISLGLPVIRGARQRAVIVTGAGKKRALAAWRGGDDLPISEATACGAVVFADEAAAGQ